MTVEGIIAIIGAVTALVVSVTTLIVALRTHESVEQVRDHTNGMLGQLQRASYARGLKAGEEGPPAGPRDSNLT